LALLWEDRITTFPEKIDLKLQQQQKTLLFFCISVSFQDFLRWQPDTAENSKTVK